MPRRRRPVGPRLALAKSGNFEIRWNDGARSRRVSTGTSDRGEAERFLAEWIFRKGEAQDARPTVGMVLSSYLEDKGKDGATREGMAAVRLSRVLGATLIDKLDPKAIGDYGLTRAGQGVKNATIRRELGTLVAAINHAVKHRRLRPALAPVITLPAAGRAKESVFTSQQLDTLFRITAPRCNERMSRLHRFIWIAYTTASRRAAVEGLRWDQVDFTAGVIRFDREALEGARKIKRRVAVPIADSLLPVLARAWEERISDTWVLDQDGELYQAWRALMSAAAKETGDEGFIGMTPHDLRRTWATQAARAGVSLWDIAGVLGDSLKVVTEHYAHHSPDYLRSAVNFQS